jgi:hypothetical protein
MNQYVVTALMGMISISLTGCGGAPAPLAPIDFTPERHAAEAMAMYDANKDGKLDAAELKKCPALASALLEIDKNGDKCIDAAELTERFESFVRGGVSLSGVSPKIVRSGRPAAGVTVTLEPEKFMGGVIKSATGVSSPEGDAPVQTEGQSLPGAGIGYYQVILSQKDAAGKELLPAKFNSATTLGCEIAPGRRSSLVFDLDR